MDEVDQRPATTGRDDSGTSSNARALTQLYCGSALPDHRDPELDLPSVTNVFCERGVHGVGLVQSVRAMSAIRATAK